MNALQSLAQLASSQIVDCFVLGTALAALAGIVIAMAGRRNSGLRFLIWFAALIATASLFFFRPIAGSTAAAHSIAISLRPEWALYIFGAWAFFACLGLARVGHGLWRVHVLKKSCTPIASDRATLLQPATGGRKAQLCTSARLRVPAALGFFRPVIALPTWSLNELSDDELRAVILHESAHLQRWDDWTNLLQKVIRALLFFHPAVWWIDSRLSVEREMSCDDVVLANSHSPRQYATCLVSLAEKTRAHRSLALVQAAVSHLRHTAKRIAKILDGNKRTATPLLKPAFTAIVAFGAFGFVAVQNTPELVSFRDASPVANARAAANKFDYVANADQPHARAFNSSLTAPVAPATAPKARKVRAPRPQPSLKPAPLPSQTEQARGPAENIAPGLVNAAMTDSATPSFVYLVTQTEQYDGFGNVTITTSVWRIRVMKPAPTQIQNSAIPNRT